jgi:hypothetical protein
MDATLKLLEQKESHLLRKLHDTCAKERQHNQVLHDIMTSPRERRELRFDNYFYSYINDPSGKIGSPNLSPFNTARGSGDGSHRQTTSHHVSPRVQGQSTVSERDRQKPFVRLPPDPRRAQIVAENMRLDPSLEIKVLSSMDLASERANEEPKRYANIVQQIL